MFTACRGRAPEHVGRLPVGWRDGQDQVLHEVHDEEEDQDLHALRHQDENRGPIRSHEGCKTEFEKWYHTS